VDLEDPAVEARSDALRVDALGQGQRPRELPPATLQAVVARAVAVVLGLALTGQREHVALQLDCHVVLGHAGKVCPHDEVVLGLDQSIAGSQRRPPPFPAGGPERDLSADGGYLQP
jgi:hypothetical protein